MSKVLSTFSRRTQHTQEGIMAGQVRDGRGGVREGGRAGYLKGDRVRVWCARRDNELPQVFSPQAWRVDDFMGDNIGVVPEIHRPSQFRTKGGLTEKMCIKFYVPPDQLTFITPPRSAKQAPRPGALRLGVYAERSVRRAKQAAGIEESQPEQQEPEIPGSSLRHSRSRRQSPSTNQPSRSHLLWFSGRLQMLEVLIPVLQVVAALSLWARCSLPGD
jgi:hypothetical protein